jgi:hypothetical protein
VERGEGERLLARLELCSFCEANFIQLEKLLARSLVYTEVVLMVHFDETVPVIEREKTPPKKTATILLPLL